MDIIFNETEQKIISKLVLIKEFQNRPLQYYIYYQEKLVAIEWNEDYSELQLVLSGNVSKKDEAYDLFDSICEKIFLLKKLERHDLIGVFQITVPHEEHAFYSEKYTRLESGTYQINLKNIAGKYNGFDPMLSNKILTIKTDLCREIEKYLYSGIYVSQDLKELVKDKFVSRESKRHEKTMCVAWWAIAVSASIGIASLIISLIGIYKEPSNQIISPLKSIEQTNIDMSKEVDSIREGLKKNNEKIPQIKKESDN